MGSASESRRKAGELPQGDVVRVLLNQHALIRDLFEKVVTSQGEERGLAFQDLRTLLAVHETAEEMLLRPVTTGIVGAVVTNARNAEELEANKVIKELERVGPDTADFERYLRKLQYSVDAHAESEEQEEFPAVLAACDLEQRRAMGRRILAVERLAPIHVDPNMTGSLARQWAAGPFAVLIDRMRDAIAKTA